MKEYIERNKLLSLYNSDCQTAQQRYLALIDAPVADVAEVSHGEWKLEMTGAFQDIRSYSCSNCGFRLPLNPTKIPLYCEDCGARMTEERVYGESET